MTGLLGGVLQTTSENAEFFDTLGDWWAFFLLAMVLLAIVGKILDEKAELNNPDRMEEEK